MSCLPFSRSRGAGFTIEGYDPSIDLVSGSWCVKSGANTTAETGTRENSTSRNRRGVVHDVSEIAVSGVTSCDDRHWHHRSNDVADGEEMSDYELLDHDHRASKSDH